MVAAVSSSTVRSRAERVSEREVEVGFEFDMVTEVYGVVVRWGDA